jgi:antitoxin VapB
MAISLKDPETERLARAIAALTGEDLTVAIRRALEERLERERLRRRQPGDMAAKLLATGRLCAALPDVDDWNTTGDGLYDATGLWR